MSALLTKEEKQHIELAVKKAESQVSGEIVPVLLNRSHHYPSSKYKLALIASVVMFLLLIIADRTIDNINIYDPIYYFTLVYGAAIIGFLVPVVFPRLSAALATEKEKSHAVEQQAETIFLENEVFNTKYRTGIMLFISIDERRALVMADTGINQKVEQTTWDDLISTLINSIKRKELASGITNAINSATQILLDNGFNIGEDDTNELSDNIITER